MGHTGAERDVLTRTRMRAGRYTFAYSGGQPDTITTPGYINYAREVPACHAALTPRRVAFPRVARGFLQQSWLPALPGAELRAVPRFLGCFQPTSPEADKRHSQLAPHQLCSGEGISSQHVADECDDGLRSWFSFPILSTERCCAAMQRRNSASGGWAHGGLVPLAPV